jgi:hypothetical protein
VKYDSGDCQILEFEDGSVRRANLEDELAGEVFEPLRDK